MENIVGQNRAIEQLQTVLRSGRMHHAYTFCGPAGIGKFTTAAAYARVLLCHGRQSDLAGNTAACGECASCRLLMDTATGDGLDTAAHPDCHVIRKELVADSSIANLRRRKQTNIPIDLLRELMIGGETDDKKFHESAAFQSAHLSHGQVFIIDEAELLDPQGQNALLKTLEEPPAQTYIILVTASVDRLLMTIRSRCQPVVFVPLSDAAVADWLDQRPDLPSDADKRWLITFASGSLGRAQLAIDYELGEWAQSILPQLDAMAQGRYPDQLGAEMAARIDTFAKAWVDEHENASKEAANKRAAGLMWAVVTQHARSRITELATDCDPHDPAAAETVMTPWLGMIDSANKAQHELNANINPGVVTDHLVSMIYRSFTPPATANR